MHNRLDDCVILHSNRFDRCTAVVDKHFLGYCTLQYMMQGTVDLSYNSRSWRLSGRWIWPAFPGPLVRFRLAPPCRFWIHRYIAVRGPLVDEWRAAGLWPSEPQPAPPDPDMTRRFDEMLALAKDGDSRRRAVNALEAILLILAEHRKAVAADWLERARQDLAAADGFRPDIGAIAERCSMPASTFRRRFKKAAGLSPRDFILMNRLQRARSLLSSTAKSISEIADDLGYRDVFFFSRQFRRHTGIAPVAYRRSALMNGIEFR
jgi:AraC-like DNA-binding protein